MRWVSGRSCTSRFEIWRNSSRLWTVSAVARCVLPCSSFITHLATADTVHKREEFRQIVSDVQDLPETQRTALLLREIDALAYDQIAEAMDTTVSSVKSLLVRARVSLAEASEARMLTCDEVRLELGQVAEGLGKTSAPARRHLRSCDRCRFFKGELRKTNKALAAIYPLGPLVFIKKAIGAKLATAGGGAGAAAGGSGGAAALGGAAATASAPAAISAGLGTVASKAAAGVAAAALVTVGAVEVRHVADPEPVAPAQAVRAPARAAPAPIPARTPEPVVAPAAVKPEPEPAAQPEPKIQPQPVAKPAQAAPTPPAPAVAAQARGRAQADRGDPGERVHRDPPGRRQELLQRRAVVAPAARRAGPAALRSPPRAPATGPPGSARGCCSPNGDSHLRGLPAARPAGGARPRGRELSRGPQPGVEAAHRLRARGGREALLGPDHPLRGRGARGPARGRGGELPPRRIAGFKSEVLVLGALSDEHGVVLLRPDRDDVAPGDRIG